VTPSHTQSVRTRLLCGDKTEISQQELMMCVFCRVRRPLWSVLHVNFLGGDAVRQYSRTRAKFTSSYVYFTLLPALVLSLPRLSTGTNIERLCG